MKKIRYLPAIMVLTILLSSCVSEKYGGNEEVISQKEITHEDDGAGSGYTIREYTIPALGENEMVTDAFGLGNEVYVIMETQPPFFSGYRYWIFRDGKSIYTSSHYFYAATVSDDGVYILENGETNGKNNYCIQKISSEGKAIKTIELSTAGEDETYLRTIICLKNIICLTTEKGDIFAFHDSGEIAWTAELPDKTSYLVSCEDSLIAVKPTESGNDLFIIDSQTGVADRLCSCTSGNISNGDRENFLFVYNSDGIYSVEKNGKTTPVVIWEKCAMAVNGLLRLSVLSDGEFLTMTDSGAQVISQSANDNLKQRKVLKLATINADIYLQKTAASFNRSNAEYQIQIYDYSEGGTIDNEKALMRLNTEILSGTYPDLVCFSNISPYPYIARGLLEDMSGSIFGEDINLDDIAIKNALGEQMFFISGAFDFETLVAKYSSFGDAYGWTMNEYIDIDKNQLNGVETIHNMTQESFIDCVISRFARDAIDWENGECFFNTPEFTELLESGTRIRKTPENSNNMVYGYGPAMVGEGTQIAALSWVEDVWKLAYEEYMAGCKLSFIGWPTVDGSCGSDIHLISPVGIFQYGENKEGCREFVKFAIMNVDATAELLPIYTVLLKEKIEMAQKDGGSPVKLTENDISRFIDLLSHMTNISIYDENVMTIIRNECTCCFNSAETASDAAKNIQTKVSLYMAEQG